MTPAQLALAWVYSRDFVASTIIGATTMAQLRENIRALNYRLPTETTRRINAIYDL